MTREQNYSWTQPCCAPCWNERNPERHAIPGFSGGYPESCVYCGQATKSGIYVRENPATAPHPTLRKDSA